tara:strand:+ start:281 stop:472 length:192 start_codon:yes stop_codon:yes gene_type:complete
MAKYKAKVTYLGLDDSDNFNSLASASTHLLLKAGLEIEWNKDIPQELKKHLTEIKNTKKGGKE